MEREKIERDLLKSGFTTVQSEALSYLFAEMTTKRDVRELRAEMQGEFRAVRNEMASESTKVASQIQAAKAELREAIAESGRQTMDSILAFQNKLFTLTLALVGTLTAIFTLLAFLIR